MNDDTGAELAARLVLGRTIADDFTAVLQGPEPGPAGPDWYRWAVRLHAALTGLVAALDTDRHTARARWRGRWFRSSCVLCGARPRDHAEGRCPVCEFCGRMRFEHYAGRCRPPRS
jgi:hypothetical protein